MTLTTKTRRRARAFIPTIALLAGAVGLGACSSDKDINAPISGVAVTTFKDQSFNFTTLHTFAMPDTVVHFDPVTGTPLPVSRQFDQVALNQVRVDLLARGYTEITEPSTVMPDFVVLVGATATQNFSAFASFSWFSLWGSSPVWAWYAPGFDNSWGIVAPFAVVTGPVVVDTGTLIVDLVPTLSVNPLGKTISSAWAGVAAALLNGTVTSTTVTDAINQMFALSPYLTATP
jgi:hypothetical protein